MPRDETKNPIVIIGAGGHAVSVTNVALSCGFNVVAYVDDNKVGTVLCGTAVISTEECRRRYARSEMVIAVGDNAEREKVARDCKESLPRVRFPALIHRSCVVGFASTIGEGCVAMPLSNIGPNARVGRFCLVNTHSSLDHDCTLGDFASIAPGGILGGNVRVGVRSAIGMGTTVRQGRDIGDDVVVGAGSFVNDNLEDNILAYGTPCKKIRSRRAGDRYLD